MVDVCSAWNPCNGGSRNIHRPPNLPDTLRALRHRNGFGCVGFRLDRQDESIRMV